ncbi:rhomboid family intramembrane serine protease GlpG [Gallaecimonas kandeliae]|uniref:rhomboid family intramembrane serine protease GlpG n=1 Tax=Gallaecimonas kandeliae TaxID=3029055 RepID=UPI00264790DA|nr:rhomboid family intramembrane serine protease GlpG [Gallaecimonas kandeliae]WKE65827.1 rhomboid family intramembrane serine protease GlpG [Gallaecimonas kandeliae]
MSATKILGHFPDPRLAQGFVDYLGGRGVRARLVPTDSDVMVEVALPAPDWLESAWQTFLSDPGNSRYQAASWQSGDAGRLRYQAAPTRLRLVAGPLTWGLMGACILVYLSALMGFGGLYQALSFPPSLDMVSVGNAYRLVTPILLHFSLLHIGFNLLWWWQLGGVLEKREGSLHLLLVTLVTGFAGNLAQFLASGPNFGGLSGVVYGLFGYFWISGLLYPRRGLMLPGSLVIFMLAWLVMGFVGIGLPIANQAHLWGLIAGCALAALPFRRQ